MYSVSECLLTGDDTRRFAGLRFLTHEEKTNEQHAESIAKKKKNIFFPLLCNIHLQMSLGSVAVIAIRRRYSSGRTLKYKYIQKKKIKENSL